MADATSSSHVTLTGPSSWSINSLPTFRFESTGDRKFDWEITYGSGTVIRNGSGSSVNFSITLVSSQAPAGRGTITARIKKPGKSDVLATVTCTENKIQYRISFMKETSSGGFEHNVGLETNPNTPGKFSNDYLNQSMPKPSKSGHSFTGWYTSATGGTKIDPATYTFSSNMTLYPRFIPDTPTSSGIVITPNPINFTVTEGYTTQPTQIVTIKNTGSAGASWTASLTATGVWEFVGATSGYLSAGSSTTTTVKLKSGISSSRTGKFRVAVTGKADSEINMVLTVNPKSSSSSASTTSPPASTSASNSSGTVKVGDKVQVLGGAIDVTNGVKATAGKMYGDGGPNWGTVVAIETGWSTGGRFGLPQLVTKVKIASPDGTIVWQVQPQDIAGQAIRTTEQPQITPKPTAHALAPTAQGLEDLTPPTHTAEFASSSTTQPYVTTEDSEDWVGGNSIPTSQNNPSYPLAAPVALETPIGSASELGISQEISYETIDHEPSLLGVQMDVKEVLKQKIPTVMSVPGKQRQLLNLDTENIQNQSGFPLISKNALVSQRTPARYDYRIRVGDDRYPIMQSMEDRLMEARASFGIPVHGNRDIGRLMKYYMYNRFKVPDKNMAHNKTITHVFFTRPDLNVMKFGGAGPIGQTQNHTESAMLWRRNPLLFKLLTDSKRAGDSDNFNLLLSNQCTSIDVKDENLTTKEAGKSWSGYEMQYGDQYSGRAAGEFSCNFVELNDYSIINLIKLWISYIDNVSRGVWSPSYNLQGEGVATGINQSHVYTKTLDYGASAYVFKCGPDGEDILYWTKYYGIFPVNTGASVLSWELGQNIGDAPRLNINFKYSFKRDLNPISLIEFNDAARSDGQFEPSWDPNYGHSSRPFVGAPFVEMFFDGYDQFAPQSVLRLKYKKFGNIKLGDDILYRNTLSGRRMTGGSEGLSFDEVQTAKQIDYHPDAVRANSEGAYDSYYNNTEDNAQSVPRG